jgi:hypothetical protein
VTCTKRTWVGAYVLDRLEPDESSAFRDHVAGCPACQDDVVSLAWLPSLLRTVSLDEVEQIGAGDQHELLRSSSGPPIESTRSSVSSTRWRRFAGALGGLVAAAGLAVGLSLTGDGAGGPSHGPERVAVQRFDPRTHVQAALALSADRGGTRLRLSLRWVPSGEHCSLIAYTRDGRRHVVASWVANYRGNADVSGTTTAPLGQLRELDVVTSTGRQLARLVVPHAVD